MAGGDQCILGVWLRIAGRVGQRLYRARSCLAGGVARGPTLAYLGTRYAAWRRWPPQLEEDNLATMARFLGVAETVGCSVGTVNSVCSETADLPESLKPAAEHLTDFVVPLCVRSRASLRRWCRGAVIPRGRLQADIRATVVGITLRTISSKACKYSSADFRKAGRTQFATDNRSTAV